MGLGGIWEGISWFEVINEICLLLKCDNPKYDCLILVVHIFANIKIFNYNVDKFCITIEMKPACWRSYIKKENLLGAFLGLMFVSSNWGRNVHCTGCGWI